MVVKSQGQEKREDQLLKRIKDLEQSLLRITKAIEALKDHPKREYNVYIDKIDVHSFTLEELSFSLENIDVNELSGAMNIGNTFSPSIETKNGLLKDGKPKVEKEYGTKVKEELIKKLTKMKENSNQQQPPNSKAKKDIKVTINGKEVSHKVTD